MTFIVGDKVRHKSSSRLLVVTHIVGSEEIPKVLQAQAQMNGFQKNDVWCEWLDDTGQKHVSFFRCPTLEKE